MQISKGKHISLFVKRLNRCSTDAYWQCYAHPYLLWNWSTLVKYNYMHVCMYGGTVLQEERL